MTAARGVGDDPFDTASLRERVLRSWSASVSRFREDTAAEAELVRGAYRDRVLVELVQNAVDAAGPGGARVLVELTEDHLTVANTGVPLDAAGVEGLSTLRASTKRDPDRGTIGRFGVGFAAVLALTDDPIVVSADGAVRWSAAATESAVRGLGVPALTAELDHVLAEPGQDAGHSALPVLRLPFPVEADVVPGVVPVGGVTAVVLPLRDAAAVAMAAAALDEVDDALLLAMPGLAEVELRYPATRVGRSGRRVRWTRTDPTGPGRTDGTPGVARVDLRTVVDGDGAQDGAADVDAVAEEARTRSWLVATGPGAVTVAVDLDVVTGTDPWAVATAAAAGVPDVAGPTPARSARLLHAPTPTDDAHGLPALVIGGFAVDSSRRRVQPGAATEAAVAGVGEAYAALVRALARGEHGGEHPGDPVPPSALAAMVPSVWGVSEVDTALRAAARKALARTAFVAAGEHWQTPRTTVRVPGLGAATDGGVLRAVVPGLADRGWWEADALDGLGAQVLPLEDVVDALVDAGLDPGRWREVYAGLDGVDPESLMTIGVPLADGRTVRGARGALLPDDVAAADLRLLGLRCVHPEAVHPLLRRLGALPADPVTVLDQPGLPALVAGLADADAGGAGDDVGAAGVDGGDVVSALLRVVAASGLEPGARSWWSTIPLATVDGDVAPAGELWLPGAPALDWLDPDVGVHDVVDAALLDRVGVTALRTIGVRAGLTVLRENDVVVDEDVWHDLDDEDGWVRSLLAALPGDPAAGPVDDTAADTVADLSPPLLVELVAVRDLDLVRADAWPAVLTALAGDPETRAALLEPAVVVTADGRSHRVPGYTAWWLREHVALGGQPVTALSAPGAEPLLALLLPSAPVTLRPEVAQALGMARTLVDVDADVLLDRLADPSLELAAGQLERVLAELVRRERRGDERPEPPEHVRVPRGSGTAVVAAEDVVVVDAPQWWPLLRARGGDAAQVLPGPAELADLLDLELAGDDGGDLRVGPTTTGASRRVPPEVRAVLADAPETWTEHDRLLVDGVDVDWWVEDGEAHAATTAGLARALAWAGGRWAARWVVQAVLEDPDALDELLAEATFDQQDPP